MIVTLTPNPALDRTLTLAGPLVPGSVHRPTGATTQPGGKGLNVARVLAASGARATALVPASATDPYTAALRTLPAPAPRVLTVQVSAPVRVSTAVTDPDGTTTKLNEPGAPLTRVELDALADALVHALTEERATWCVLSGSLPPGAPDDWYALLLRRLRRDAPGVRLALDTSDTPLRAWAATLADAPAEAAAPDLIAPNTLELTQALAAAGAWVAGAGDSGPEPADVDPAGLDPARLEDAAHRGDLTGVTAAARQLRERSRADVLLTLGAGGALLTTPAGTWHCPAPRTTVRSTVGAGDATLAGYLLAVERGAPPEAALSIAVAHGSAAVTLPGTGLPAPEDVALLLPQVPPARQLTAPGSSAPPATRSDAR